MLTIESVKCRICGTKHAAEAAACPVCGSKTRPTSTAGKPSAGKAKPEPFGLDPAALLAKIDALDWEDPTIQSPPAAAAAQPSLPRRSLLLPFLIGFVVLLTGTLALRYYSGGRSTPVPAVVSAEAPSPAAGPSEAVPTPAMPGPVDQQTAPAGPDGQPAVAPDMDDAAKAKQEEARRQRAELKRKALAAKQAMEEQGRLERAEQERLRAEREAAETRARAAAAAATPPAPKGPASPQEVCAAEQNVFSRGACEARTCAEAQWRSHPFCVKRWQDELRKLSPSGGEN